MHALQPGRVFRAGGDKYVVYLDCSERSSSTRLVQNLAEAVDPGADGRVEFRAPCLGTYLMLAEEYE